MIRLVVCAAIRNRKTSLVVCGVRHGDCLNFVANLDHDGLELGNDWECGFVDQERVFMTREEAWKVADGAGQIRRPTGFEQHYNNRRFAHVGDEGMLFSENLY